MKLAEGVVLKSHVVIEGDTEIGSRTIVHPFAVLGGPPQHLRHKGEPTKLKIGADALIREHVTMHAGTVEGGGVTIVGDRVFFMGNSHVAHDCCIGDDVICTNFVAIGGHANIGKGAILGALAGIHQFCRIGSYAFVGGCAAVTMDVIPYASAFGNHARLGGLNIVGMKRRGLPRERIHALRGAYQMLFGEKDTLKERVEQVRAAYATVPEIVSILEFIDADAPRPLMTPAR